MRPDINFTWACICGGTLFVGYVLGLCQYNIVRERKMFDMQIELERRRQRIEDLSQQVTDEKRKYQKMDDYIQGCLV